MTDKRRILLKEGENYLYSFSLNSGMWSRITFSDKAMLSFIKFYPQLLISDSEGNVYNLSKERKESIMPFVFTTRAIKISNNYTLKQLKEVIFKGELNFIDESGMTLELFGSNYPDRGFHTIAKAHIKNSFVDGVRISVYAPAYKYFRISGYGNAKSGMNINNIHLSCTLKYNSRIR